MSLLDVRSNFVLAALFVTWLAVALLVLIVGNLYARLQRLERGLPAPKDETPYGHLIGRDLQDLLGAAVPSPCVFVLLSANCNSCLRVLSELPSLLLSAPLAVTWVDEAPAPPPALPPGTIVLDDGPRISTALGIRVTPFVLVTGDAGEVVEAAPLNSLSSLGKLAGPRADALPAVSVMTG
ncbi:MAG TPA: hypothetical protein VF546_15340 [Pyrinomonadaceae bacterium]|jgi:hypothetical protein